MEKLCLWEYKIQTFGNIWKGEKTEDINSELNQWGAEGWEVVSSSYSPNNTITVLAKRPISEDDSRRRRNSQHTF